MDVEKRLGRRAMSAGSSLALEIDRHRDPGSTRFVARWDRERGTSVALLSTRRRQRVSVGLSRIHAEPVGQRRLVRRRRRRLGPLTLSTRRMALGGVSLIWAMLSRHA